MCQALHRRKKLYQSRVLFAAAAAAICSARLAIAQDNWTDGTGNWSTAGNWSAGVPASGNTVNIIETDGVSRTITYDYTGTAVALNSLTLDLTNFSGTASTILAMSANNLSAANEYVGDSGAGSHGVGAFNQSGGVNAGGSLYLGYNGTDTGFYVLSATGSLAVSGTEYIGNSGTGNFNQSGGTNTVTNSVNGFIIGNNSGSTGSYTLSGTGTLAVSGFEYAGFVGTGSFNQSGGINTVGMNFDVGSRTGANGTYTLSGPGTLVVAATLDEGTNVNALGAFTMSGGSVSATTDIIGVSGTGSFTQSGGTNSATNKGNGFIIGDNSGSTGSYTLSGTGTLAVTGYEYAGFVGTGSFTQTGGLNTVGINFDVGSRTGANGTYNLSGPGTLVVTATLDEGTNVNAVGAFTMSGGSVSAATGIVGLSGTGSFAQSGGTNSANTLYIGDNAGSTGNYTLSNTGSLAVSGNEYVGDHGVGGFNQSGGTNAISGANSVDLGFVAGSTGTYSLSGSGSLAASNENVGYSGVGTFNQSGGLSVLGGLNIGNVNTSTGTYTLSSGSLTVSGAEFVGYSGNGTFNQSAGTQTLGAGNVLNIANNAGSTGAFILSGTGTLSVGSNENVGNSGNGSFNQSGGSNSMTGRLYIGTNTGSTGSFILSAGAVTTVQSEYVGNAGIGTFNQTGGTNTGEENLYLSDALASNGTYNLQAGTVSIASQINDGTIGTGSFIQTGGTLAAASIVIGGNSGTIGGFSHSGGSTQFNNLTIGNSSGSTGSFTLSSAATLTVANGEYVGYTGAAVFTQTGGQNIISPGGNFNIASIAGSTGTYNLSDTGIFTDYGNEYIAGSGSGTFNQTGGVNTIVGPAGDIYIGSNTNSTGAYLLSNSGSLAVSGSEFVGNNGNGTFNQTGGTNSITGGNLYVAGSGASSTGALNLSGTGMLAVAGDEYVGFSGKGYFNQAGGVNTLSSGQLILGENPNSTGSYTLSAGSLASSGDEFLGNSSAGNFNQSGGTNTVNGGNSLFLGVNNAGTGAYILSGSGSLAVSGTEYIGDFGAGSMNQSGGTNTVDADLYLGGGGNSSGAYTLGGTGVLTVGGSEYIGDGATGNFIQTGGLNVVSGDNSLNLGVLSGSNGAYTLTGGSATVSGSIYVGGSSLAAGGTGALTVSNAGQLSVAGMLKVWNGGRVNLDVPSTSAGNLSIVGNGIVNLNGTLQIDYGSAANDPVASIVSYLQSGYNNGAWTGTAGIISTSVSAGGRSPVLSIGYADGNTDAGTPARPNQIVIQYALAGDANLDGQVNSADLLAVIQNLNKTGTDWSQGNFTYGTSTNSADLLLIIQNFNQTLPPPAGSAVTIGGGSTLLATGATVPLDASAEIQPTAAQVPEPRAMAIAVWAAGLLTRRRRQTARPGPSHR